MGRRIITKNSPPWRGFIDGESVALELAEVRERYGRSYGAMWFIDKDGVRLARDLEMARRGLKSKGGVVLKEPWPDIVELFVAARREDAPLATMVRDAEARG